MYEFINNLLPRLKNLSKTLNHVEVFVDKAWVFYDPNNNIHEYTFLRDQRLIVSFNGQVQKGKWELLPTGKLLLDVADETMILENTFINKVVLILKKNGLNDQPFILFDQKEIPDGNIELYLEKLAEIPMLPPAKEISNEEQSGEANFEIIIFSIAFIIIIISYCVIFGS